MYSSAVKFGATARLFGNVNRTSKIGCSLASAIFEPFVENNILVFFSRTLFLSLLALSTVFTACKKDASNADVIDFGPNDGFSHRDAQNRGNGTQDPTDWTLDGAWNPKELALFRSLGLDANSQAKGAATIGGAFPNAASSAANFGYSIPGTAAGKIIIVDRNHQVMTESSTTNPSGGYSFVFDFTRNGFLKGQRYRLYYVLYNGTTLYYKGHGDIKIAD